MENHNFENEGQFQRKMSSRHLFMLSLGGVIGTGWFLSSGYTIAQAGPLGAVLSYLVGAVVVWLSIPMAQINFRKAFLKEHSIDELSYQTPFTPVLPYITIILLVISIIGIAWDASQRAGLYFGIPFVILCYVYHYLRYKKW